MRKAYLSELPERVTEMELVQLFVGLLGGVGGLAPGSPVRGCVLNNEAHTAVLEFRSSAEVEAALRLDGATCRNKRFKVGMELFLLVIIY